MKKLEQYVVKGSRRLRMGYTTGTCAAAAAGAATAVLLSGNTVPAVRLTTPAGISLTLDVEETIVQDGAVTCAVRKDAGDDPDITDGMLLYATVQKQAQGIAVDGGEGIGRVTRPGLQCPVGAPAINPVPLRMIREEVAAACARYGYAGGLRVVIFAPQGAELAKKTFNPRLGIEGGLSVLGTSGIVEPMSERALVDTIRAEIDARRANGDRALLLVPGNYGRDFARARFGLDLDAGVKISNFLGEALDYAVYSGFEQLLLLGHAGKLMKIAAGVFQTHSSVADARTEILAAHCGLCGCSAGQLRQVMQCITVDAADALLREWGVARAVWRSIGQAVQRQLQLRTGGVPVGFAAFAASGILMRSPRLAPFVRAVRTARTNGVGANT